MIPSSTRIGSFAPSRMRSPPTSDSSARMPPSPSLSARSTKTTYFSDTISISAQKISDTMPKTSWGSRNRMADAGERNLERIKRAGADVAVDDAERGQRQKPGIAQVMLRPVRYHDALRCFEGPRNPTSQRRPRPRRSVCPRTNSCSTSSPAARAAGLLMHCIQDLGHRIAETACLLSTEQVQPHNRLLAMAAPSLSARSLAQTMLSATIGSARTAVPKPQSTPAISRSRSMTWA